MSLFRRRGKKPPQEDVDITGVPGPSEEYTQALWDKIKRPAAGLPSHGTVFEDARQMEAMARLASFIDGRLDQLGMSHAQFEQAGGLSKAELSDMLYHKVTEGTMPLSQLTPSSRILGLGDRGLYDQYQRIKKGVKDSDLI